MRKYIVWMLLLCPAFSLYAQSNSASVFVLPVMGTGSMAGDNAFFYKQISSEITYQYYKLAKTLKDAEFYLVGTLYPYSDNADTPGKQYVFHLSLLDTKTNAARADGELVYTAPEDAKDLLPVLVSTVLNTIPAGTGKNNWRNKRLYVGGCAFWTPRIYTAESASTHIASFGGGIFAEYHFLDFLALGGGVELASDLLKVFPNDSENYSNTLLEIPLLLKFVIKPGDFSVLEPYGGIYINIPFNKIIVPPKVSWLAGLQYGIKAGPGVVYIDPRFSMDMGKSALNEVVAGINGLHFQRYIIHLGIGYKLGFFTRR